jgi:hypothetical protein
MRNRLLCRILAAIAMCIAVASIAACGVSPGIDGGIVGTGNRMDCEPQAKKDGSRMPVPQECKPESAAPR